MFHSLRARLWLSYAALVITALVIVGVVLLIFLLRNPFLYRKTYDRLAAAEAALRAQADPTASIPEVATALDVRILHFDAGGNLLSDSRGGAPALRLPANPLGLRRTGMERDFRGKAWFYSTQRLDDGGWLLLAAPRPNAVPLLAVLTDELSLPFLEGGIIALLLSLALGYMIARWVADPLQQVIAAAGSRPSDAIRPLREQGPREVRAVTRAFNAMVERVRLSHAAQRDFVANVSHELKTPLTSIQGFAQALMDGTADSPESRQQAARIIYDEAGRMHRIALDLLELARIDAGTTDFQRAPVDLMALLRGICDKFQPLASSLDIALRLALPAELSQVEGDGDRLAQVFDNLVDNALKFTPTGGVVTVRALQDRGEIQVSVNDSGKGIPANAISHIFDRFYQVDQSRGGGEKHGAGLGLAIAREIVLVHGGKISVRSAEGRGTGFVVHLPLRGTH